MTKRQSLLALLLAALTVFAACGGGGDDGDDDGANASATPRATQAQASGPDSVKEAPEGEVNRPKSGTYYYEYSSESTNAATPDEPKATSKPDAQLARKIGYQGSNGMAVGERSTEGPAVAETNYVWEDDRLLEVGSELRQGEQTNTCTYEEPVIALKFPLKAESYGDQSTEGDGEACGGTRKIEVVEETTTTDANGNPWSVWHIKITTTSESNGLRIERTDQRWLSPDLGTDVRYETDARYINPEGGVSAASKSVATLKTYPSQG
jgi:hypothetical protein